MYIFKIFFWLVLFIYILSQVLEFEKVYLGNIPSAESYEKSFMHRDLISHIVVTE